MSMQTIVRSIGTFILDILYPPVCLNCKTSIPHQKQWLCARCISELYINTGLTCPQCGARTPTLTLSCRHATPYILAAACPFTDPIPALIHHYKYNRLIAISTLLSAIMIVYAKRLPLEHAEWIVSYIPLHWRRERERTFNQSRMLAEKIAQYFSFPLAHTLVRTTYTRPQAYIKERDKREFNVTNCFTCYTGVEVQGKNIILVDDVSTSGATLAAAARELKKSGAHTILALVVARA